MFLRAKIFVQLQLPKLVVSDEMRCMQRFFRLKQKETLKLMRDHNYPDPANTADFSETSDSDGEADLIVAAALQQRAKHVLGLPKQVFSSEGLVAPTDGAFTADSKILPAISTSTPAMSRRQRATVIIKKQNPKVSDSDLEAARNETLNVMFSECAGDSNDPEHPLEAVIVDPDPLNVMLSSECAGNSKPEHALEAVIVDPDPMPFSSESNAGHSIHFRTPEPVSDADAAKFIDPEGWSLWKSFGDLDPIEAIGIIEILSSMRRQEVSRAQPSNQNPRQRAKSPKLTIRVKHAQQSHSQSQQPKAALLESQTLLGVDDANPVNQHRIQVKRLHNVERSKPTISKPDIGSGLARHTAPLHPRPGSLHQPAPQKSQLSASLNSSATALSATERSFPLNDALVQSSVSMSNDSELDDLQRIQLRQQNRESKIRDGLASFGIENMDGLDDATAFGLAAIIASMEKREHQQPSNSKLMSSHLKHGKSAYQSHLAPHNDGSRSTEGVAREFLVLPKGGSGPETSIAASSNISSGAAHVEFEAKMVSLPAIPDDVASSDFHAAHSYTQPALNFIPTLDSNQDQSNFENSSGHISTRSEGISQMANDATKMPLDEAVADSTGQIGRPIRQEDIAKTIITKKPLVSMTIFEQPKIKDGLASFGIENLDGLDDATQFGLAAILMGMKTREQRQAHFAHQATTEFPTLRRSPSVFLKSDGSGAFDTKPENVTSSDAQHLGSLVRPKPFMRVGKEASSNVVPPSSLSALPPPSRFFLGSSDRADNDDGLPLSPYLSPQQRNPGKSDLPLRIPTFDFDEVNNSRNALSPLSRTGGASRNQPSHKAAQSTAASSKVKESNQHEEVPRSLPFVAWQERTVGFNASDIEAVFGNDDVAAAGLRAIMQSSPSKLIGKNRTQLGRRSTRE